MPVLTMPEKCTACDASLPPVDEGTTEAACPFCGAINKASMKLVRFSSNGQAPRLGILLNDSVADVEASVSATLARRGITRARGIAAALVPPSTRGFLEGGAATLEQPRVASFQWTMRWPERIP